VDVEKEEAHLLIAHCHSKLPCVVCRAKCNVRDHGEGERVWRHLDLWQAKTFLHASMPRTDCPEHGVKTVAVPWGEPHSRFSLGFEARVILAIQSTKTVAGACALMKVSWDEARGLMERAVARGLMRREDVDLHYVAVDEKSYRKCRHFVTLLMDLDRERIHGVAPGNSKASLESIRKSLSALEISGITAIAMHRHGHTPALSRRC